MIEMCEDKKTIGLRQTHGLLLISLSLRLLSAIRIALVLWDKVEPILTFPQEHLTDLDPIAGKRTGQQRLQFVSAPVGWWSFVELWRETFKQPNRDISMLEG